MFKSGPPVLIRHLRLLLAAALIGLAVGGAINAEAQPTPQTEQTDHSDAGLNEQAKQDKIAKPFWEWLTAILDKTRDDPVAFCIFVVAVFTGILGISTIGLWIVTAKGNRDRARDTQILERAYLNVEPAGIEPHHERGDRVVAKIIIRNVGRLPARNVTWWSAGRSSNSMEDRDFPIEKPKGRGIALPPGRAMKRLAATVFTGREGVPVLGNTLCVWGIVRYRDGFGRKRFTEFRHYYITKPFIGHSSFSLLGEAAESDDEGNDAN
jgi:hypothetical protein